VPDRTAPCFVDPRHGPSVTQLIYPESGLSTPVPVCAGCQASLGTGAQPRPRMLLHQGTWTNHWMAMGPAWIYLNGYWPGQPFVQQGFSHYQGFAAPPDGGTAGRDRPAGQA